MHVSDMGYIDNFPEIGINQCRIEPWHKLFMLPPLPPNTSAQQPKYEFYRQYAESFITYAHSAGERVTRKRTKHCLLLSNIRWKIQVSGDNMGGGKIEQGLSKIYKLLVYIPL